MTKPESITLTLPWPITLNHLRVPIARKLKGRWVGRIITSDDGEAYKMRVAEAVLEQGNPRIEGVVKVTERFYCKTNARYDIDNYRKAMRDALVTAGVIEDDHKIFIDHGIKCPKDPDNPRVEVTIESLERAS